MQVAAGPGVCCICLKPLKKPATEGGRKPIACWSADCRAELESARGRHRRAIRNQALRSLAQVVESIGWSTSTLSKLVNP